MNLFDNAEWLKIPELKRLDDELLNYIDYIYNEFPKLHYTDDQWINIIKCGDKSNNKDISKFMQKYVDLYINNSANISAYTFIKYDTNRLKNIIKKLSIEQIYHMLNSIIYNIGDIFFAIENIKKIKYLYSFVINYKRLYSHYIHIRIINPINSVIISHLLSKYSNDDLIDFYKFVNHFLIDFYCRKQRLDNNEFLLNCINSEYTKQIYSCACDLYNYYLQRFIISPDRLMLTFLLDYNIKPINNENSLKIVNFVKKQNCILTKELLNAIIASCNLTTEQIDELKALNLLNNI